MGGLWHELGELQFQFLIEHGLRPEHVFLDIACGSLRAGVRLIPYLNAGNYLGIDIDSELIDHGRNVEIGNILLEIKKPEFQVSGSFEFNGFSKQPDFAIAQSLFTHLSGPDILLCLRKLREFSKDDMAFYATFFETGVPATNLTHSHPHAAFRYTRDEMDQFAKQTSWKMHYIGDWNHPREQKMLRFSPVSAGRC